MNATNERKIVRIARGLCATTLRLLMALFLCLNSLPQVGSAQLFGAPQKVGFQGRLTDLSNNPLNGTFSLTFSLYGVPSGGSPTWTETQTGMSVVNGAVDVTLGSVTPIPFAVAQSTESYLEIQVDAETLNPRQPLHAVLYSMNAAQFGGKLPSDFVDTAGTQVIGGQKTLLDMVQVSSHVNVSGTVSAASFVGNGSLLTGVLATVLGDPVAIGTLTGKLGNAGITITSNVFVNDASLLIYGNAAEGLQLQQGVESSVMWVNMPNPFTLSLGGLGLTPPAAGALNIDSSGNVGIGTMFPAAPLDVAGDIRTSAVIRSDSDGKAPFELKLDNLTNANLELDVSADIASDVRAMIGPSTPLTSLAFKTGVERMRITDTGSVGIGTTAPIDTLHVEGGVFATGMVNAANFVGDGSSLTGVTASSFSGSINANQVFGGTFGEGNFDFTGLVGIGTAATSPLTIGAGPGASGLLLAPPIPASEGVNASPSLDLASTYMFSGSPGTQVRRIYVTAPSPGANTHMVLDNGLTRLTLDSSAVKFKFDAAFPLSLESIFNSGTVSGSGDTDASLTLQSHYWNGTADSPRSASIINDANPAPFNKLNFQVPSGSTRLTIVDDGKVGIGTSAPAEMLHVVGQTGIRYAPASGPASLNIVNQVATAGDNGGTRLQLVPQNGATSQEVLGVDGALSLRTGGIPGSVVPTERLRILSGGNVGIGTASPASILHVKGPASLTRIVNDVAAGGEADYAFAAAGTINGVLAYRNDLSPNSLDFFVGGVTGANKKMTINTNGDVGIGTATPTQKLDVAGTVKAAAFEGDGSALTSVSGSDATKVLKAGDTMTGLLTLSPASGNALVTTAGNVGIGTASPGVPLHLMGSALHNGIQTALVIDPGSATTDTGLTWDVAGISKWAWNVRSLSESHRISLYDIPAGNVPRLTVMPGSGNVGIGTFSPAQMLHVADKVLIGVGNPAVPFALSIKGTSAGAGIMIENPFAANQDATLYVNDTGFFGIRTNGAQDRLAIDMAGNVGIGTATPASRLDVAGTVTATQFVGGGAGLTGVTGTDATKVLKAGDTMTGPLTLSGSTLTVTGSAFSVGGSLLGVTGTGVGIGTTSPSVGRLDVNGTAGGVSIQLSGTGNKLINASSGFPLSIETGGGALTLKAGGANSIELHTQGAPRMYVHSSGNVGIGTATPGEKLHLQSAGPSNVLAKSDSNFAALIADKGGSAQNNYLNLRNNGVDIWLAGTIGNDDFVISNRSLVAHAITIPLANNNVGIGTTNPTAKLEVSGDIRMTRVEAVNHVIEVPSATGGNGGDLTIRAAGITAFNASAFQGGNLVLQAGDLNTAGGAWNGSGNVHIIAGKNQFTDNFHGDIAFFGGNTQGELMRLQDNGNLGIGTSAPVSRLEVAGTVTATQFVGGGAGLTGVTGTDPTKVLKAGDTMTGLLTLSPSAGNALVTTAGNVGIGTTGPTGTLHVDGGVAAADVVGVPLTLKAQEGGADGGDGGTVGADGGDIILMPGAGGAGTPAGVDGAVGIGVTPPASGPTAVARLLVANSAVGSGIDVVSASGLSVFRHFDADATTNRGNLAWFASGSRWRLAAGLGSNLHLTANDSDNGIFVAMTGNVGIGTTSPAQPLHVERSGGGLTIASFINPTNNADTSMYMGQTLAAGRAGRIAFQDNIDGTSGYMFLGNFGDPLTTGGLIVKKGGAVGIGTTLPSGKLHVDGGAAAADVPGSHITLKSQDGGADGGDGDTFGGAGGHILLLPGVGGSGSPAGAPGNVGIGTGSPAEAVEVRADGSRIRFSQSTTNGTKSSGIEIWQNSAGGSNIAQFLLGNGGAEPYLKIGAGLPPGLPIRFYTNISAANPDMTIVSGGDVGIGTTIPAAPLEVRASGANQIIASDPGNGSVIGLRAYFPTANFNILDDNVPTTDSAFWISQRLGASPQYLEIAGMAPGTAGRGFAPTLGTAFLPNGEVGIGTAAPKSRLQVNGDVGLGDSTPMGNAPVVVFLVNKSGAPRVAGEIVTADPAFDNAFNVSASPGDTKVIGVVLDASIPADSVGRIAIGGVALVKTDGTAVSPGHHVETSTVVPGQAKGVVTPANGGSSLGVWLESANVGPSVMRRALLR